MTDDNISLLVSSCPLSQELGLAAPPDDGRAGGVPRVRRVPAGPLAAPLLHDVQHPGPGPGHPPGTPPVCHGKAVPSAVAELMCQQAMDGVDSTAGTPKEYLLRLYHMSVCAGGNGWSGRHSWYTQGSPVAPVCVLCVQAAMDGVDNTVRGQAKAVARLRTGGSFLLTTLLVASTAVSVAFTALTVQVLGLLVGFFVCATLVLVFVEILPPALCAQHSLRIAAGTAWLARGLLFVLFPIAFPLSLVLDKYLAPQDADDGRLLRSCG